MTFLFLVFLRGLDGCTVQKKRKKERKGLVQDQINCLAYMHAHNICPPLLTHPGWHLLTHTCTGSHTHRDRCHTLEQWAAIHRAWGAWGYSALLKGTSTMTRRWTDTPPAVNFFLSGESGNQMANLSLFGRPTLTTEPRPPHLLWQDCTTSICYMLSVTPE